MRCLTTAVRRLRTAGAEVVVGTCPDLGTIEPVYQPLRWLARRVSRQLAAAQTIGTVEQGGRTVSLGDLLGPEFAANPRELFGPDNYHPSAEGYATAAMAVLPTLCAVLGLWPETDRLDGARREDILPVAKAASQAAREAGTEVTGARGSLGPPQAPQAAASARLHGTHPARPPGRRPRARVTGGVTRQAALSKRLEKSSASHGLPGDPGDTSG
ncbi:hypothetical protein GA0115255_109151 [Streptomyces sp. Ncost-T6T-2b]|nr:hypothetical protein GA0115255_109151 [Streptomyces sp. Ncost-T6T-2b]